MYALSLLTGVTLICLVAGVLIWGSALFSTMRMARTARSGPVFPDRVRCILCGRRTRVSLADYQRSAATCACGQRLYLPGYGPASEHPPLR